MNGDDRIRLLCDQAQGLGHPIQGVIQRVDYVRRELTLIAQGRVWRFRVPVECRLWFNGSPAILRCFHPLDPVTVVFRGSRERGVVAALYYRDTDILPLPSGNNCSEDRS